MGSNPTPSATKGEARLFGEFERGLTRNISVAGGAASFALEDGKRHTFVSLGLRASVLGAFTRLDVARDDEGGTAVEGSYVTNLFGVSVNVEHAQFFDFVSERFPARADPLQTDTSLRLNGTIPESFLPRIPISLAGNLTRAESGRFDATISNRLSAFVGRVSASNSLTFLTSGGGGTPDTQAASGSFLLNSRLGEFSLRGDVNYTIEPEARFTTVDLNADRRFGENFNARLGLTRQLTGAETTTVSPSVSGIFAGFALGLTASASDDDTYSAGLTLSFGVGREPRTGSFALRPRRIASSGAASVRAFLDLNQNDVFDEGDEPLPGVRFVRQRDIETNEEGIAFLTGMSTYRPTNLAIDLSSLEDPFWIPINEGVEVVPRPGRTVIIDFPVTPTGEVDGTVFLRRGGEEREVSNVQLQLVDLDGNVVKEVKSEFDGFYLFDFVRPGHYILRIAPEQAERLKLVPPPPVDILIEADDPVISGIDFVLERAGETRSRTIPDGPAPAEPQAAAAAPSPPPPPAPPPETPYKVQLSSYRSAERAEIGWELLKAAYKDLLADQAHSVERADLGPTRGVFYRLRVGPLPGRTAAADLCGKLKERGSDCFVVPPDQDRAN